MEFKILGMNFQLWKLRTFSDYAWFFLILLAGCAFFWLWNRSILKKRNDASAKKRVMKKLSSIGGRRCSVIDAESVGLGGADALFVTPCRVFVLRCIGRGTRIYGSIRSAQWRAEDNTDTWTIENPLTQLAPAVTQATKRLSAAGESVQAEPLAVFADPFQDPKLQLEGGIQAVTFKQLKKWYKGLPSSQGSCESLCQALKKGSE